MGLTRVLDTSQEPTDLPVLLGQAAALTGPHFRYEEESLYPGLVQIFGEEYIEKLLGDHDVAIGTAKRLVEMSQGPLSDEDVQRAVRYVRSILPHVSDSDGLSIMVERLPERDVQAAFFARDRAREANLNLLEGQFTILREIVRPAPGEGSRQIFGKLRIEDNEATAFVVGPNPYAGPSEPLDQIIASVERQ